VKITNNTDISLSLAVWLINDEYDYQASQGFKEYISVTTLMRPTKQIVLAQRVPIEQQIEDVEDYISRGLGNSIHDSIEKAWVKNYRVNLAKLSIPEHVIDLVAINPTDEERIANPDMIPIYLEQRGFREINGVTIGGKFDLVAEGHVEDNKSTSAFGWVFGTRDEENQLQGSLYRWIDAARNVPRITEDFMRVNYIFTDWQKMQARTNPKYPQSRVKHKDLPLLSLEDTEMYVKAKLHDIKKNIALPEEAMVECSDADIWRSDPQFKYYTDPAKTDGRSTKNFDTKAEADAYRAEKGKGVVITKLGEPKRCEKYCAAFSICKQKDRYFA
jgi:hypothetical protein